MSQVKRDHQIWSLGDEDEDFNHIKGKGKICMVATADVEGSTKLEKTYGFMEKYGTLCIVE